MTQAAIQEAQILIVEDEGIVAMELKSRLQSMGYRVIGNAATGEMAIQKAGALQPDLILMDIKLKGTIDGITAAEQIRTQLDIPIIYLTAYADAQTLQRAKITEPYGYLLKPFEERELQIAIEMALYKHAMQQKAKGDGQWFTHTLHQVGDAIIATNAQGQINFMNQNAEALTGWSQGEAMGQDVTQIFQVIDEASKRPLENPIYKALRENVLDNAEHDMLLNRSGLARLIHKQAASIRDKAGHVLEVVLVFRDATTQ